MIYLCYNNHVENSHITIKKYSDLSPILKKQYEKLKKECFGWVNKLTPEQLIEHNDKFCSRQDKFLYIFAIQDGIVIGQMVLLKRKITYMDKNLLLGGIGGVGVTRNKRRLGTATALLKAAFVELKKAECDIAYLCYDTKQSGLLKLYGQIGFIPLGKPHTYTGVSGKRYIENDGMIAPINSLDIFNKIVADKKPFDIGKGNW